MELRIRTDGRSLRRGLDFVMPYLLGEKEWPHEQIEEMYVSPTDTGLFLHGRPALRRADDTCACSTKELREAAEIPIRAAAVSRRSDSSTRRDTQICFAIVDDGKYGS